MTVEELIQELKKFDPKMEVLGEFDTDGDDFMIKVNVENVYEGDGLDDGGDYTDGDEEKRYCIIKLEN